MSKKTPLSQDDQEMFRQLMSGTRKLKQDTIVHKPVVKTRERPLKRLISEQADNSHYFSDEFQPLLSSVMTGQGKHILKQQTPLWLAQHPHVMAFHQAPKMFGGDAALLVLIEVEEWQPPELP